MSMLKLMHKYKKVFDWYYTRYGGYIAVKIFWLWSKIFRKTKYIINVKQPINKDETVIFASNHMNHLDPPAIFSSFKHRPLFAMSPVKFMTTTRYYNSVFKPLLYTTGCYPHKGPGLSGVHGSIIFAAEGYRVFIFPEGKLNRSNSFTHAYDGIVRILDKLPDARLILVHIQWEKRTKLFSRPSLTINISDAPDSVDRTDSSKIMHAIYNLK